jgi:fumarate reductase subunit C
MKKFIKMIGYAIIISMFCVSLFVFITAMSYDGTLMIDVNHYNEGIVEIVILIIGLIFSLYLTLKYFKGEIKND